MSSLLVFALLQTWRQLDFNLNRPEEVESFPYSPIACVVLIVGILFFLWKARRNYMALPELPAVDGEPPADLTVVIPARNEARTIARCVESFPDNRVIVVNDSSVDGTATEAKRAGAEVIDAPPLLKGVLGKPNALFAGEQLATTDYVLFVDADTYFDRRFPSSAVKYASDKECVLVSAFLKNDCRTIAEKMLLPYAFALSFCGVNAKKVQNVLSDETLANGQCMLFQRTGYEFFGGHRSVHSSVIEDVAIAEKVKRHRMKLRIMRAEHLGAVRVYDSLGAIWHGFKKNTFRFLRANKRVRAQAVIASVLLTSIFPVGLWTAYERQWPFLATLLLTPVIAFRPWYGGLFRSILSLPAILIFQLIALDSMITDLFGRKTKWKGRKV